MKSRVVIIAALALEIRPLIRNWKLERSARGVTVYSSDKGIAAFAGMGAERATLATAAALSVGHAHEILSVGLAGGLHAGMRAASVHRIRSVIDASSGESLQSESRTNRSDGGPGAVLATLDHVASAAEKRRLRDELRADLVDMEALAVAREARARQIPFGAIKAVSDEHDFALPGLERFATPEGQFRELSFALHIALRPALWKPVQSMARNSAAAARKLCAEIGRHLDADAERSWA